MNSFWWLLTLTCLNVLLTTKLLAGPSSHESYQVS
jgi:hypothetical protein